MPSHLIKMKNSYFQREFSESTEERISTFFNFSDNENLLCAVWTASFLRYGFVVSDKALYWFLKTSDGIKSGGILREIRRKFPLISSCIRFYKIYTPVVSKLRQALSPAS